MTSNQTREINIKLLDLRIYKKKKKKKKKFCVLIPKIINSCVWRLPLNLNSGGAAIDKRI